MGPELVSDVDGVSLFCLDFWLISGSWSGFVPDPFFFSSEIQESTLILIFYNYKSSKLKRTSRWLPRPFPPLSTSPFLPPVLALPLSDLSRQSLSLVLAATAEMRNAIVAFAL